MLTDGRTDAQTDDGRKVITIGELKIRGILKCREQILTFNSSHLERRESCTFIFLLIRVIPLVNTSPLYIASCVMDLPIFITLSLLTLEVLSKN